MFKRIFWLSAGFCFGVVAVSKAEAYVRANTPDKARQFVLGPDEDNVASRTLGGLIGEFNAARRNREDELSRKYADDMHR
ncbi:hypothetical protein [Bifidobacterium bombi]|uniref:Putative secreted protein n=1 Tax=Bifidobacterium bombi DSM 19703 TaxID=1341695 RepID=A0A080N2G0_9BIFI|nr:hypothetical protein [Bifidobacterium bombi]KFF31157.1 putative secreted protein [Bifidobacterium bombi DSM 19703]